MKYNNCYLKKLLLPNSLNRTYSNGQERKTIASIKLIQVNESKEIENIYFTLATTLAPERLADCIMRKTSP